MTTHNLIPTGPGTSKKEEEIAAPAPVDPRQRALAFGLEFTKRCFEARTVDDVYLLLTNDLRGLIEFDRSILVVHNRGTSRLVAAGSQPILEKKSKFYQISTTLAQALQSLNRGVLVSRKAKLTDEDLPKSALDALQTYLEFGGSSYLLCVPLNHSDMTLGHLLLEFMEEGVPDQVSILTVLNIAPFLAAAMAEKWLLERKPRLYESIDPKGKRRTVGRRLGKYSLIFAAALASIVLLFVIPVTFDVGGEAEIVPTDRHIAFCQIDGLIDHVNVKEGSTVSAGQVLATLDPKDLDFKVKTQEKQLEILTTEMQILRLAADTDPSKLAESNLVKIKRKVAWEELQYLKWQQQFLRIKAPIAGIILTRDIDSLTGKKLKAGEPFCEIVVPGDLSIVVFVPEDRVTYVKKGQKLTVHLAGNPRKAYDLKVNEIAPAAEVMPRIGNVYRVRAPFPDPAYSDKVGMKGIAKIHVKNSCLWFIVTDRLLHRWQRWSLYFS